MRITKNIQMIVSSSIKKKFSKEFTSFCFNGSHGKMANAELSNVFWGNLIRLLKCFDQWFLFSF